MNVVICCYLCHECRFYGLYVIKTILVLCFIRWEILSFMAPLWGEAPLGRNSLYEDISLRTWILLDLLWALWLVAHYQVCFEPSGWWPIITSPSKSRLYVPMGCVPSSVWHCCLFGLGSVSFVFPWRLVPSLGLFMFLRLVPLLRLFVFWRLTLPLCVIPGLTLWAFCLLASSLFSSFYDILLLVACLVWLCNFIQTLLFSAWFLWMSFRLTHIFSSWRMGQVVVGREVLLMMVSSSGKRRVFLRAFWTSLFKFPPTSSFLSSSLRSFSFSLLCWPFIFHSSM